MKDKPAISIIVPVYNIENYIGKCLNSILNQTFTSFEVIVVNDGSTDRSGLICSEFSEKDNRIKVIHKENGGISSARNIALDVAQGDYLAFVDGDDLIRKDMLYQLYYFCTQTNSDIAICKMIREFNSKIVDETEGINIKVLENENAMRELFKGHIYRFSVCSRLFKKSCIGNIRFPENQIHEDLSTSYKIFSNAKKTVYINYSGYVYLKRENSILTSPYNEKRLESFTAWEAIISFMNLKYPRLSDVYIPCLVYWIVDNVYYILNQVENNNDIKKYLNSIRYFVRNHYKLIMNNKKVTYKYKYIITLLYYNIRLLIMNEQLKRIYIRICTVKN